MSNEKGGIDAQSTGANGNMASPSRALGDLASVAAAPRQNYVGEMVTSSATRRRPEEFDFEDGGEPGIINDIVSSVVRNGKFLVDVMACLADQANGPEPCPPPDELVKGGMMEFLRNNLYDFMNEIPNTGDKDWVVPETPLPDLPRPKSAIPLELRSSSFTSTVTTVQARVPYSVRRVTRKSPTEEKSPVKLNEEDDDDDDDGPPKGYHSKVKAEKKQNCCQCVIA